MDDLLIKGLNIAVSIAAFGVISTCVLAVVLDIIYLIRTLMKKKNHFIFKIIVIILNVSGVLPVVTFMIYRMLLGWF